MAVDKLVDSTQLDADLTSVADAIRTKGGTSAQMAFPVGFIQAINTMSSDLEPLMSAVLTSANVTTSEMENLLVSMFNSWENNHIYFLTIRDNTATGNYKGLFLTVHVGSGGGREYVFIRTINSTTSVSTTWEFRVSAGATVSLYDEASV